MGGYIDDSIKNKENVVEKIIHAVEDTEPIPSTFSKYYLTVNKNINIEYILSTSVIRNFPNTFNSIVNENTNTLQ